MYFIITLFVPRTNHMVNPIYKNVSSPLQMIICKAYNLQNRLRENSITIHQNLLQVMTFTER